MPFFELACKEFVLGPRHFQQKNHLLSACLGNLRTKSICFYQKNSFRRRLRTAAQKIVRFAHGYGEGRELSDRE